MMLLKNISLGMYYPGKSLLHRLQARTKLLALVWIAVWLMISNSRVWQFIPYTVAILFFCTAVAFSGISPRLMWRRMWLLLLLVLIGGIANLTSREVDQRTFSTLGPLPTSYGVVQMVLLVGSIVMTVVLLCSFLPFLRRVWQRGWLKLLRIPLVAATIVALVFLWLIGNTSPNTPFALGPIRITYGGVWTLVSVLVALLVLYGFSVLLTMTTSPIALIEGMTILLAPLRRLRLPVDDFALMALLALRFIPTLLEEVEQLTKAQTARGADVSSGTLRERLQSLAMLFVPLMQGVLRRASELATALEARGYEVEGKQTFLYEKPLARIDYVVLGVVVAATVGAMLF
jgi:energy-coupling factor transporter transmembrane protein EcfT